MTIKYHTFKIVNLLILKDILFRLIFESIILCYGIIEKPLKSVTIKYHTLALLRFSEVHYGIP